MALDARIADYKSATFYGGYAQIICVFEIVIFGNADFSIRFFESVVMTQK